MKSNEGESPKHEKSMNTYLPKYEFTAKDRHRRSLNHMLHNCSIVISLFRGHSNMKWLCLTLKK